MWAAPGGAILAAVIAHLLLHLRLAGAAFMASTVVQAGTILTAGFALFPFLMPSSTYPNQSLTIWDASSSPKTLFLMLCAALVFIPIILAYTTWVFRVLKGRSTLEGLHGNEGPY
jgi:cytochrome d ubiquinol oxidase subunit II